MGTEVGVKMFEIPEKSLEGPSAELFRLIWLCTYLFARKTLNFQFQMLFHSNPLTIMLESLLQWSRSNLSFCAQILSCQSLIVVAHFEEKKILMTLEGWQEEVQGYIDEIAALCDERWANALLTSESDAARLVHLHRSDLRVHLQSFSVYCWAHSTMSDILFSWNQRTAQRFYSAPFTRATPHPNRMSAPVMAWISSQKFAPHTSYAKCFLYHQRKLPAALAMHWGRTRALSCRAGDPEICGNSNFAGLESTNVRRIGVSRHYRNSTYERTDKLSVASGDESHAFRQIFLW